MLKPLILHLLCLNLTASTLLLKGNRFSSSLGLLEKIEKHGGFKNLGLHGRSFLNTSTARYEYFTYTRSQSHLKVLKKTNNSFSKPSFIKQIFKLKNKFDSENNIKFKGNDNKFPSLQDENGEDWLLDGKAREDGYKITTPEENPYSVLLIIGAGAELPTSEKNISYSICTGTLITQEWVLTATHCFYSETDRSAIVYAGASSRAEILSKPLNPKVQVLTANPNHVFMHPNYSRPFGFGFDIALVKVLGKFKITEAVKTMELFQKPWTKDYQTQTPICQITGFGIVQYNQSHPDDFKRKTNNLKITDSCKCINKLIKKGQLLCNKPEEDFGICQGDSGGGLICEKLVGVVSLGVPYIDIEKCNQGNDSTGICGSKNTLSIFVPTYPHLSWINSHIHSSASCFSPLTAALLGLFTLVISALPM